MNLTAAARLLRFGGAGGITMRVLRVYAHEYWKGLRAAKELVFFRSGPVSREDDVARIEFAASG